RYFRTGVSGTTACKSCLCRARSTDLWRCFPLRLFTQRSGQGMGSCLLIPSEIFAFIRPTEKIVVFEIKFINCVVCAGLFSAADRCFPRARLQPPRENHSAGSSDTCYSRGSQRSSAPNDHHNSESEI